MNLILKKYKIRKKKKIPKNEDLNELVAKFSSKEKIKKKFDFNLKKTNAISDLIDENGFSIVFFSFCFVCLHIECT